MESVRALVERLGGGTSVATALGTTPSAVSQWVIKDAIPPRRLLPLVRLARKRGVDWTPAELAEALGETRGAA